MSVDSSFDLFAEFGVTPDEVEENPFRIPKGRYNCTITDAKVDSFKNSPDIPQLMIEFTVSDGPHAGKKAQTNHRLKKWTPEERAEKGDHDAMNARLLSNYKRDLMAFGFSSEIMKAFRPANPDHTKKLIGLAGSANFGPQPNNPEFNMVSDFERASNGGAESSPAPSVAPVAQKSEEVDLSKLNW